MYNRVGRYRLIIITAVTGNYVADPVRIYRLLPESGNGVLYLI